MFGATLLSLLLQELNSGLGFYHRLGMYNWGAGSPGSSVILYFVIRGMSNKCMGTCPISISSGGNQGKMHSELLCIVSSIQC